MSAHAWPDELMFDAWGRPNYCLGPGCINALTHPATGRSRRYCSKRCSENHRNRRRRITAGPLAPLERAMPYRARRSSRQEAAHG